MKYLKYNTCKEAKNKSSQEAILRGCSGKTQYWFQWQETEDNKYVLLIPENEENNLSEEDKLLLLDNVNLKINN